MEAFKRIFAFLKGAKKEFIIAVVSVFIETAFELVIPLIMANMINQVELGKNANMDIVYLDALLIVLCALMSYIDGVIYSRFSALASAKFGSALRKAQFEKIQTFSFSNLDKFEPSSLVTRVINDSQSMQNVLVGAIRPLVRAPIMLILGIVFSFVINVKLALIFVVLTPVLALVTFGILKTVAPEYIGLQKKLDDLNMIIQENLVSIRAIKSFIRKPYECQIFDDSNRGFKRIVTKTLSLTNLNLPTFQLVMYLSTVLFMWFGGNMIIQGSLAAGDLTGLLSYVMQTFNSLMMISSSLLLVAKSLASIYRIDQVLSEEPTIKDGTKDKEIGKGDIEFQNVSFRYNSSAEEDVLSGVSFKLEAGKTMGILGPTGSAKSTLVQLIPRLYEVSQGAVLVDGQNVKDYSLNNLRDSIAMVLQKSTLFEGTVLDNLKWGNPQPSPEELDKALRISCADELIQVLPEGINTQVGEGGNELSGGQKQRICLARALLKNPKVLILDDTTSAVDTTTEKKIREGLISLQGMTKIIISQRILSVMEADEIMILSDGKIVQIGSHEELMKTNLIYQDLYNSQLKGVEDNGQNR